MLVQVTEAEAEESKLGYRDTSVVTSLYTFYNSVVYTHRLSTLWSCGRGLKIQQGNKGNPRLASEDVFIRVVVDRANIVESRPVCSSEIHSIRQSSLLSSFPILTIHLRGSPNKPVVAAVWSG